MYPRATVESRHRAGPEQAGFPVLTPCIFQFVLLGSFEKDSQAGVICPVATGQMTVRVGTFAPGIRFSVMRPGACFTRAHCPKLEPLVEHDNSKIVARILQV
jgi:hypothetical protein